jgi:hypothetical protein
MALLRVPNGFLRQAKRNGSPTTMKLRAVRYA